MNHSCRPSRQARWDDRLVKAYNFKSMVAFHVERNVDGVWVETSMVFSASAAEDIHQLVRFMEARNGQGIQARGAICPAEILAQVPAAACGFISLRQGTVSERKHPTKPEFS
jgi:hypothetical protein